MTVIDDRLAAYRQHVEQYLKQYYARFHGEPQGVLFESIEYSLLSGGKRLRSTLVLEFCRMIGGEWKKALPFAAAIEMIHTYSLIHDDLPCMDNDDFRRGKPTNHKVYGDAMAILAGDALLTDAFTVASTAQLPAQAVLEAIQVLSECAGSLGMVGGQVLDIQSQNRMLTEQEVLDVQTRKTGALIRAACAMGAIAGGATPEQYDAACQYAAGLGLAFQIRDDILDVEGDEATLGKPIGSDARSEKNTYVTLKGLETCRELVDSLTDEALAALESFEEAGFHRWLAQRLAGREN